MSHKMSVIKVLYFYAFINFALAYNYELPTDMEQVFEQNLGSITTVTLKDGCDYNDLEILLIENQHLEMEAAELLIDKLEGVPKLSTLSLENNKISGTFDLGRLKNLKKLNGFWISENQINKVVNTATENMPSVKIIQLFSNNLSSIDLDIFDRFPNLEELGLNGNKFTGTLDLGKLKRFKSLKELYFNKNEITEVVNTATEDMPSVTRIDISENSLSFIDFQIFDKFPNLKQLDLNKNKIAGTLDLGKLKRLKSLTRLFFNENNITEVVNTATENMPSVTRIDIGENSLSFIDFQIFDKFPNLRELDLNKNKIAGTLDLGKLKRLKRLKELYFYENEISMVVNTETEKKPSVAIIHLGNNKLSSIELEIFDRYPNLKELNLGNNKFTGTLDLGKLKRLKKLEELYFNENEITEIVNTATKNMPSVKKILLYQNNLTFLDLNAFDKFINIEIIQLNKNQLISITGYEKANIILPKIEYITINKNNFVCSDLENMVSSHDPNFWYIEAEIETSCYGLKSQLFRENSCCYPNAEDQTNDMQYKQMPSKQPQY